MCATSRAVALLSALLAASAQASSFLPGEPLQNVESTVATRELEIRAFPNAPNGYTPQNTTCPSTRPSVRSASALSHNETSWLETRRNNTIDPMKELLSRLNISGFDAESYINKNAKNASALPNIAIALSGGGYRACLNGGGAVQAFDGREANATTAGHLGGLLQSSTYIAGLSGGGWLVGSIYVNNFSTITGLLNSNASSGSVWEFDNSIFDGPSTSSIQVLDSAHYYTTIEDEVSDKADAGFNTSVTDYWARALAFQLVNASDGGASYTWSSIQQQDSFATGGSPMPILVADGRAPGETLIPVNTTVYEFNPFEFGSWDPTTYGFVPLEFLGSNFSGGVLAQDEQCVRGFDNVGYVMGTSSSLFNQFLLNVDQESIPQLAKGFVKVVLNRFSDSDNDIAQYQPNPFYGYNKKTSRVSEEPSLTLVDGGEDLENIPLHPLIQPFRHVDVIFAVDSSADTNNFWPNGTSLVASYERSISLSSANGGDLGNGTSFPAVPDQNTFVNLGLNTRPTFFGCNSSNTSSPTPLIVYIPNSPYTHQSNMSTFTSSYNTSERDLIVANGYNVATMGNGTANPTWPACVGCAILQRSLERTRTAIPQACARCFADFCWDGTVNSTAPAAYEPPYKIGAAKKSAATRELRPYGLAAIVAMAGSVMIL